MATTSSLKQGETRTTYGPIPHPLIPYTVTVQIMFYFVVAIPWTFSIECNQGEYSNWCFTPEEEKNRRDLDCIRLDHPGDRPEVRPANIEYSKTRNTLTFKKLELDQRGQYTCDDEISLQLKGSYCVQCY